ncbi:MAG: endonuclease domain-containing protein [Clostridia bacterium]|nr:endonuclease domain-containing protein [Clostridia bacterium]
MKPYNKNNITLAKELRKNMTKEEKKLWYDFLREYPVRFQRQKAIGEYIADFYCAKAGLIVELDGSGHFEDAQALKDRVRTERLEEMHLTVIRFTNLDVIRNFEGVCMYIDEMVKRLSLSLTPFDSSLVRGSR